MKTHTVQQGECLASLALENGLFPETIWNHPDNAGLKRMRKDATVLLPGDQVVIPDKRMKYRSVASGATHRFRRKGVPQLLKIRLMRGDAPRKGIDYSLEVDDLLFTGATDGDGWLEQWIPPDAASGKLVLGEEEVYTITFGHLNPESDEQGARSRLVNLGLLSDGKAPADAFQRALRRFQEREGLAVNGELDAATQEKLQQMHSS